VEAFSTRPLDAGPDTFVTADALVLAQLVVGKVLEQLDWSPTRWQPADVQLRGQQGLQLAH
jgi:hypothetical protein